MTFQTKDSGKRVEHDSGMVRDVSDDKIDYTLALDGPMFERYAQLMHRGQKKYGKRNWMKANSQKELDRATESLTRHFFQYIFGQTDEDHAAAVMFNINEMEYIKPRIHVEDGYERKERLWREKGVPAHDSCDGEGSMNDTEEARGVVCELPMGHDGKHSAPGYCVDW